jgi:hypothetical protein
MSKDNFFFALKYHRIDFFAHGLPVTRFSLAFGRARASTKPGTQDMPLGLYRSSQPNLLKPF